MVTAASLVAQVSVSGADQAKSDLQSVGDSVNQTGGFLKNALGGALSFAAGIAGQALGFLKNQLVDSIKVAMDHQQVMSQTAQVLRSTKDASGETANAIGNLATSLSEVTPFSEDTVQSGENLLLTFTGIGKQVFPQATQAMLDMAQAMHQGPEQGAIMLGKALNDPATGLTALTRVGVTFSAQEKEQIKTMMAHNDIIGAQKIMLKELETEFGGSAQAAGKTFSGALQILQNNLEDVKIKIGTALLPILAQLLGWISSQALPALERFSDWFSANAAPAIQRFASILAQDLGPILQRVASYLASPAFASFASSVGTGLVNAFQAIASGARQIEAAMQSPVVQDLLKAFQQMGSYLLATFEPVLKQLQITWQTQLLPAFQKLLPALQPIAVLVGGVLVVAFGLLIGVITGVIRAFAALLTGAIQIAGGVVQMFTGMIQIVSGILTLLYDLITGQWSKIGSDLGTIWDGILNLAKGFGNAFMGFFGGLFLAIRGLVGGFIDGVIAYFTDLFDALVGHSIIPDMVNAIISWFQQLPGRALGAVSSLGSSLGGFFSNLAGQALTWGSDICSNIASGISSSIGNVTSAASNVASAIASILHHSKPEIGPLAHDDEWMPHFMESLANGMTQNIGKVKSASLNVAATIANPTSQSSFAGPSVGGGLQGLSVVPSNVNQTGGSIQINVQPTPIYLDGRVLTNGIMPHIVQAIRANTGTKTF